MKGGLLFDLRRLHLAVEQASRPQLEPLGLTSAQAVVLGWLLEPGHGEVCASHAETSAAGRLPGSGGLPGG